MKYFHDHEQDVIFFARTNFRNRLRKFGIRTDDRRRHMYIVGKSGVGKTTLIENMILADIYYGHGVGFIDPHGDSAEKIIDAIPEHRINDVVYFNPSDLNHCIGFNVLEAVDDSHKHVIASGLMGVFKKIWPDVWSPRMEHIMNNCILSLLENPGNTLLGINRILVDRDFRRKIVAGIRDPVVKAFWVTEFEQWDPKFRTEAIAPIQNKVGQFLSTSLVRNIVAQEKSTIDMRHIMDGNHIFIVNLSKGRIGEDASRLLGGLLVTKMQLAAMARVDILEEAREDFYLYIDEFQNFATESFANILSEARKYRLALIMAHQYIEQLDETVEAAVFGNAGTLISFRVGSADAEKLAVEFAPKFIEDDLVNLPKANIYLKLLSKGIAGDPFSAVTLPPIQIHTKNEVKVIAASRQQYAVPRELVEERILRWSESKPVIEEGALPEIPEVAPPVSKKKSWMHEYTCSRCQKHMELPVELDRSRPIYCEDCIDIVKAERKAGKKPSRPGETPVSVMKDAEVVRTETVGEVSLSALSAPRPTGITTPTPAASVSVATSPVTPTNAPTVSVGSRPDEGGKRKRRRHKKPHGNSPPSAGSAPQKDDGGDDGEEEEPLQVAKEPSIFPW
ncbi:type IV secretion system DNA-binding domain-containing protein [Candidatus Uhrbacteria bacterium]|nr:type IV secretion system DNA-binding domain-containing protein [Candidatus Uhrbacteria bacterium]